MLKISFDISTKSIGFCVIDNEKVSVNTIKLNFNENELNDIYWHLEASIYNLIQFGWEFKEFSAVKVLIGLEVSNFKNPKITQKFSLLAGMIIAICSNYFENITKSVEFKLFNSNEWQKMIGCKNNDERVVRKQKSKDFYCKHMGVRNDNDDETDAFCIAYHLESLSSTLDISTRTKIIKKTKQSIKEAIARLNKQIITRQNLLLKLKPSQVKSRKRIENEINERQKTISSLIHNKTV